MAARLRLPTTYREEVTTGGVFVSRRPPIQTEWICRVFLMSVSGFAFSTSRSARFPGWIVPKLLVELHDLGGAAGRGHERLHRRQAGLDHDLELDVLEVALPLSEVGARCRFPSRSCTPASDSVFRLRLPCWSAA